jgi:glycosyltransferase involved in cell wall biosynthesis
MTIYHMDFAKTGYGLSGGEGCMLENARYFSQHSYKNVILTTNNGQQAYTRLGYQESEFFRYKIINSAWTERFHPILSYLLRVPLTFFLVHKIKLSDDDVLVCHNEFFPNSLPFTFLALKNKNTKIFYWFHMLAPDIWYGYKGHFTRKIHPPSMSIIHYKLNQVLYRTLTLNRGIILTVNQYYFEYLKSKYPKNKIYVVKKYSGIKIPPAPQVSTKKYDAIWVGRFHSQKGLHLLPQILQAITSKIPNFRLAIVGDGDQQIRQNLQKSITSLQLQNSIEFLGFLKGKEKYDIYYSSKIFLMTSYYESFGQVILEAMKCGLPVVAFDLPVYSMFNRGIIKVELEDTRQFADAAIRLLQDQQLLTKTIAAAQNLSSEFDWDITGKELLELIQK